MNLIKHLIVDKIQLQSDLTINDIMTYESRAYSKLRVSIITKAQIGICQNVYCTLIESISKMTSGITYFESLKSRIYK